MKNSVKTFAVALALFASAAFTAQAEEKKSTGFGTCIYPTKEGKINILVDKKDADAPTTLILKDKNGAEIYSETISKSYVKFGRILNVDALGAGKYQIDVISKGEKQTKSFQLSDVITERVVKVQ